MEKSTLKLIAGFRRQNYSYQFIGDTLGLPMNTVKSVCRRKGFKAIGPRKTKAQKQNANFCKNCKMVLPTDGRKGQMFCCDSCRTAWWKKNRKISALGVD